MHPDSFLLVDNDTACRDQVATELRDMDPRVSEADDATSAVRAVRSLSPELMVLEWTLPDINGVEVLAYNVFGERLYVAGHDGAPDGYEQPFNSLDLVWSWYPTNRMTVKAKIQNILDETIQIECEGVVTFREEA
jgi:hypothetical protein